MDVKIETSDFFGLVTELCKSLMGKCRTEHLSRRDNTRIVNEMRTTAFEILLNKHSESHNINDNQQIEDSDPVAELLKYCFVLKTTGKSSVSVTQLEHALDHLMDEEGNYDSSLKSILYFLHCMKCYQSSESDNLEFFNIGALHPALPETRHWRKQVPQYQIYPLSTFELPLKMNKLLHTANHKFTTVNLETPCSGLFQLPLDPPHNELSITSHLTPYLHPQLNSSMCEMYDINCETSSVQSPKNQQEIEFHGDNSNETSTISTVSDLMSASIYDSSLQIENRTWETFGNAEVPNPPSFVLDSIVAMEHFDNFIDLPYYCAEIYKCRNEQHNVVTMEKFIENTKLVLLGIDSNCYIWNNTSGFKFNTNMSVAGLGRESLHNICSDITHWATCFKLLSLLVHRNPESGELRQDGLIFKAMCNNISDILIHYQAAVSQVFNHNNSSGLFNLLNRLRDIGFLICEVARLCRCDQIQQMTLGEGTGILSHIYNQITKITKPKIALVYYSVLKSCCEVYFQLLEKWIFEGVCDEAYGEFLIRIRGQYLRNRGHKFWTRCFAINNEAVPGFLKNLTNSILQCGKAVRLLKICDSKNAICNLFATKRPTIKVCLNMSMLSEQKRICSEYMANGVAILGSNVTLGSAFREIKAREKEKADHVIAAQHDTLQRIKKDYQEAMLQLMRSKRELLADQKKQCEDAVSRREQARENIMMEDKLLMEQQLIEDERIRCKQLTDAKVTFDYYKDLEKEAKRRRVRATWRAQRMALFDERMHAISTVIANEASPINDGQSFECPPDNAINDENCNRSEQTMNLRQTIGTDEKITKANRPTMLHITRNDIRIIENKTTENISSDPNTLQTEAILNEIIKGNDLYHKSRSQICFNDTGERNEINDTCLDTNLIAMSNARNDISSNDNNCNNNIVDDNDKDSIIVNNINQPKNVNDTPITYTTDGSQCSQATGNDINDVTPMSCTTDSYVPSALGSAVFCHFTEAGSIGDSKNEFETPTSPGDCLMTNPMKQEFSVENIFATSNTHCNNPFNLDDSIPVIFESSLTKADVEIIDNTSLQVYLEKSVLIPLRVQNQLANSAIVKLLLHNHKFLLHLQSLRSFFFLLNGEFAKNLTGPLYTKFYEISLPDELFNSHTLTNLLKNALHCSLNSSYINSELLSLTVFENPSVLQILDPQALNCLCLHYKVSWPLNIIIDEALMQQYSKVFKFLLMVGRVLWVLQEDFCILKNERKAAWSHQYHRVQLFRHAMMQFMTALHNYITCSVLHASWTEFEKELENATTLDQIYTTHVSYIKKILSRCMLTNRGEKLRICLCNTFEIILKFHNCLRSYEWVSNSTGYIHPNYKKLEQMYEAFCTLRTYPAQVVDRSTSSGYQMHLSHFVDALNINPLFNL